MFDVPQAMVFIPETFRPFYMAHANEWRSASLFPGSMIFMLEPSKYHLKPTAWVHALEVLDG